MAQVSTVTGGIDSADLGTVSVHEHVFFVSEDYLANYVPDWDEQAQIDAAVTALNELKALGFDTILDPTVLGLGRYLPRVQKVAERTEINIVPATGLYTFNDVPWQFQHQGPGLLFDGPEPLVDLFVRDLTEGIGATGIKAAFLKCAIDEPGLMPGVERVMRAVGRASVETGAPITVHTHPETRTGLTAQKVLREEGVDLTKVVIGHSGDTTDLDYLMEVADAGSLLGMDRFGLDIFLPLQDRIDTVVALAERGYADRMVLAHDAGCFTDWFSKEQKQAIAPNWNYRHLGEDVLPALRERGVTESQLALMLVDNPRRYFE